MYRRTDKDCYAEYLQTIQEDAAAGKLPEGDEIYRLVAESIRYMENFTCPEIRQHAAQALAHLKSAGIKPDKRDRQRVITSCFYSLKGKAHFRALIQSIGATPEDLLAAVKEVVEDDIQGEWNLDEDILKRLDWLCEFAGQTPLDRKDERFRTALLRAHRRICVSAGRIEALKYTNKMLGVLGFKAEEVFRFTRM